MGHCRLQLVANALFYPMNATNPENLLMVSRKRLAESLPIEQRNCRSLPRLLASKDGYAGAISGELWSLMAFDSRFRCHLEHWALQVGVTCLCISPRVFAYHRIKEHGRLHLAASQD